MSSIFEITNTIEYKNFGWNTITFCFFSILLIVVYQIRAAIRQKKKIKKNSLDKDSTLLLSPFVYCCLYFLIFIFYGSNRNSLALFLSSLPGPFYIPIIIFVWKYRKKSWLDVLASFTLPLIIPLMAVSNNKEVLLIVMFGIGAIAMLIQAYEMIRTNDFKDVEPNLLLSFLISSIFWFIYSIATNDQPVQFSSGSALIFLLLFLTLYYRWYKKRPVR